MKNADIKKQGKDTQDCDIESGGGGGKDGAAAPVVVVVDASAAATTTDEPPTCSTRTFKFRQLASATKNFKRENLLGESGFGKVYKGTLADGKVVTDLICFFIYNSIDVVPALLNKVE